MASRRSIVCGVACALMVVACAASTGVVTEHADQAPTGTTGSVTTAPGPLSSGPPSSDPTVPATDTPGSELAVPPDDLVWEPLDDIEGVEGVELATLEVPVDYDEPDGEQFELHVARHLATDPENRIGSLLVNPGGPGFGGSEFAVYADQIYGEELLERFDIVGWDPRGTGLSEPAIDCIDDYDHYFAGKDITPDDDAERQQNIDIAEEFTGRCVEANGDILPFVGTNSAARDMDTLRRALGEETISYFGFSYGSELGATWATLFPETVRAAVLDGATDPNTGGLERELQQRTGFEGTLDSFLAQCSEDTTCAFHNDGDSEAAFDALMQSLDETPVPSEPGRPDVNLNVAVQGVIQAMYSPSYWPELADALASAADGDGDGLLALYDSYYQRKRDGTWGNELEAFESIHCMDDAVRTSVEEEDAFAPQFNEAAPRISPGTVGNYECTFFPPPTDPRIAVTAAGAGPIVVVGTTGDPATPLASTREMATTLEDGRLVVVTADQHTGYHVNECVDDAIHRYLVELEAPADETEC